MTVLITGGAGFVGLNITEQLLKAGIPVVSYGLQAPPVWAMDHLEALPGRFSVKIGDVRDREALVETIRESHVQRIVHGAAITASLDREAQQASLIAAVNLGGTIEVLEAALEGGVKRVVHLGSGSVFGASVKKDGFLDEVDDIPVPDSLYGITKYAAERTAARYRMTRGLDVVVARLGVVFGRWEYDTGVRDTLSIPLTLTRMAQAGEHAVLRDVLPDDWVYGDDVAAAVAGLLEASSVAHSVYHVSSGIRWSAVSWCARLREHYPSFTYEVAEDPAAANVGRVSPGARAPFSVARLRADLGYAARFGEAEAFAACLAWHARGL